MVLEAPNWGRWLALPAWQVWQACFLLWEFEPDDSMLGAFELDKGSSAALMVEPYAPPQLLRLYELIKAHAMAGALRTTPEAGIAPDFPRAYVKRDDLIAWAREYWEYELPGELDALASEAVSVEPVIQDEAEDETKWRQRLKPRSPAPSFPRKSLADLEPVFKAVRDSRQVALKLDWLKISEAASRNKLAYAERDDSKRPYLYEPESVARWLYHFHRASAASIALAMKDLCGWEPEWNAKMEYWEEVEQGTKPLD